MKDTAVDQFAVRTLDVTTLADTDWGSFFVYQIRNRFIHWERYMFAPGGLVQLYTASGGEVIHRPRCRLIYF